VSVLSGYDGNGGAFDPIFCASILVIETLSSVASIL
jgi:hypothetical protein